MSIQVKVRKLAPRPNDLPDEIKVEKINEVVEDFAAEVKNVLGNLKCKAHPNKKSYLTVSAHRIHTLLISKRFCCPEFEQLVSLKIQR